MFATYFKFLICYILALQIVVGPPRFAFGQENPSPDIVASQNDSDFTEKFHFETPNANIDIEFGTFSDTDEPEVAQKEILRSHNEWMKLHPKSDVAVAWTAAPEVEDNKVSEDQTSTAKIQKSSISRKPAGGIVDFIKNAARSIGSKLGKNESEIDEVKLPGGVFAAIKRTLKKVAAALYQSRAAITWGLIRTAGNGYGESEMLWMSNLDKPIFIQAAVWSVSVISTVAIIGIPMNNWVNYGKGNWTRKVVTGKKTETDAPNPLLQILTPISQVTRTTIQDHFKNLFKDFKLLGPKYARFFLTELIFVLLVTFPLNYFLKIPIYTGELVPLWKLGLTIAGSGTAQATADIAIASVVKWAKAKGWSNQKILTLQSVLLTLNSLASVTGALYEANGHNGKIFLFGLFAAGVGMMTAFSDDRVAKLKVAQCVKDMKVPLEGLAGKLGVDVNYLRNHDMVKEFHPNTSEQKYIFQQIEALKKSEKDYSDLAGITPDIQEVAATLKKNLEDLKNSPGTGEPYDLSP